jgi:hypothetical protein
VLDSTLHSYVADTRDWNLWKQVGGVASAVSGSMLEAKVSYNLLYLHNNDAVDVLFYMQSWDKFDDFSDTVISNKKGVLSVKQQGVCEDVINGSGNRLLRLEFEALSADITISEIRAKRTGVGSDGDVAAIRLEDENGILIAIGTFNNGEARFLPDMSISEGQTRTLYLVVDISGSAAGETTIGFKIMSNHDLTTSKGTISLGSLRPDSDRNDNSYIVGVPGDVKVDAAFADWEDKNASYDIIGDVDNKNLDLTEYSVSTSTEKVSFYLRVDGEIGLGVAVPHWNTLIALQPSESGPTGEPASGQPASPKPPITGEDIVCIYIDSDNASTTGYSVGGIGADHMIEIKGYHGEITSKRHLSLFSSSPLDWELIDEDSFDAETDTTRLEAQISKANLDIIGNFQVYFQTTDWEQEEDYSGESITRGGCIDFPIDSDLFTIAERNGTRGNIDTTSVSKAPASIGWDDTTPTAMLRTRLNEDSGIDDVVLEKITITHLGTGEGTDITVYIYEDVDEDDNFEPDGDDGASLGSATFSGATVTIDITDLTIAASNDEYIWIVYVFNTDSSDVGDTHGARIAQSSDLQVSIGDTVSGTFPQDSTLTQVIPEFDKIFAPITFVILLIPLWRRRRLTTEFKHKQPTITEGR